MYCNALRVFHSFLSKVFPGHTIVNCSFEMLMFFIASSYEDGKSPNTISTYLGALSYNFKLNRRPDLCSNFLIKKMMCGAKRLSAAPDLRRPITLSVLHDISRALLFVCRSFYQQKLFSLIFLMAFHAFLRIGEITILFFLERHSFDISLLDVML